MPIRLCRPATAWRITLATCFGLGCLFYSSTVGAASGSWYLPPCNLAGVGSLSSGTAYGHTSSSNCNGVQIKLRYTPSNGGSWITTTATEWDNFVVRTRSASHLDYTQHSVYLNGCCWAGNRLYF